MNPHITVSYQSIYPRIKNLRSLKSFLEIICRQEGYVLDTLSLVFCSDDYLHSINVQYLNHDTFTDIITFDYSTISSSVNGELYISYQRVIENAANVKTSINKELHRVIFHGLLHLLGYKDKLKKDIDTMRLKEEYYLIMYFSK
jgi:rRNA maturation RNase YbeY